MSMKYSPVYPDIELTTQERKNKEEKECEKKCHLCICYSLLCFSCIMLLEGILAFFIIVFNETTL